jgi:hypothetical protein
MSVWLKMKHIISRLYPPPSESGGLEPASGTPALASGLRGNRQSLGALDSRFHAGLSRESSIGETKLILDVGMERGGIWRLVNGGYRAAFEQTGSNQVGKALGEQARAAVDAATTNRTFPGQPCAFAGMRATH